MTKADEMKKVERLDLSSLRSIAALVDSYWSDRSGIMTGLYSRRSFSDSS
jgi:hypothetical protein